MSTDENDDIRVCDNGIQVLCRYREENMYYAPDHIFKLYSCNGEKVQCFDLSNETKIWEYICPAHTNPEVKAFFLNQMKLIRFPSDLERYFPNLRAISLVENQITHISKEDFASIKELDFINLSFNKITTLDGDLFGGLPNLKSIDFSYNSIKHIGHDIKFPIWYVNLRKNVCIDDDRYDQYIEELKFFALLKCPPQISQIEKVLEIRENWLTSMRHRVELLEMQQGMSPTDSTTTATTINSKTDSTNTDELCRLYWRPVASA